MFTDIYSNSSWFFNYTTLTDEPIITSAVSGEYDYENANFGLDYHLPNSEKNWIQGFKYTRVDNDSDLLGAVYLEGKEELNKFIIKSKLGEIGFVSGTKNELSTQVQADQSYFYFETNYHVKNDMGNDYWIIPNFNFYVDSESRQRYSVGLDLEKYLFNKLSLGNRVSYTYYSNPENITDVKSALKNSTYAKGGLFNFTGTLSYDLIDFELKGPNANIDKTSGISFSLKKNKY